MRKRESMVCMGKRECYGMYANKAVLVAENEITLSAVVSFFGGV